MTRRPPTLARASSVERAASIAALGLLSASSLGCGGRPTMPYPAAACPASAAETIDEAATQRIDITPPPGVSLFGYGPDSEVSDGVWTRLYCRAFLFHTNKGRLFAVVPCDLPAMSTLLQREVAHLAGIPATQVMLTATHTHSGPAHYLDAATYNGIASTKLPGFDPNMHAGLVRAIAAGLTQAKERLRPAVVAWAAGSVAGLTRNRSLDAFRLNVEPRARFSPSLFEGQGVSMSRSVGAEIDPELRVLRVDATRNGERVGALGSISFFAMHPSVLGPRNRLLSADTHGVISRVVEEEMRRGEWKSSCVRGDERASCPEPDPLHAIINTNEGDVAPIWSDGSLREVERIGRAVAERVVEAYKKVPTPLPAPAAIATRYLEVPMRGATVSGVERTCDAAELGLPFVHGGGDHPSSFAILDVFQEGRGADSAGCHTPKRPFLGPFQAHFNHKIGFAPEVAPLALLQVGATVIAFVPAEVTVTAGYRMRKRVLSVLPGAIADDAVIGGLANGYVQYLTTPEEYAAQHYEGASTLYGPNSAALIGSRLELLARSLAGQAVDATTPEINAVTAFPFDTGARAARVPTGAGEPTLAELDAAGFRRPLGLCTMPGPAPRVLCFRWLDGAPGLVPPLGFSCSSSRAANWLSVVDQRTSTPVFDDRGLAFVTQVRTRAQDGYIWQATVRPTEVEWGRAGGCGTDVCLRIEVNTPGARKVLSPRFSAESPPPPCSMDEVRYCSAP